MDGEDGIETFSPKNRSHLVFDRGREAREGRAGVAPHVQQKVSFEDASVEGTVLSSLDQDSGEEEGNEADESLTEGPQVLNVNRHHVDFLLQARVDAVDNILAATRRDGKEELSIGPGAGKVDAAKIQGLVRALRGKEWVKKVDKGRAEALLAARRDAALCDQVDSDLLLCSAATHAPSLLWLSQPPPSGR
eukprot:CAMPEP_0180350200 /NCGR_PEP_ID=MMETSP0989-20121125/5873_1 /TAXON_ID=697907 /ORGANISM="non described non described, Strain CCMP2293" /LENGTH=190 /DNA_ID=CAMNT_0022339569 /DNA_START=96 /DNA_END=665 /DNA_ORIENTATION=+